MNRLAALSKPLRLTVVPLLLFAVAGCKDEVFSDYGKRGGYTETSLNGTRVLGEMFEDAGHHVRSWRYLSPSLDKEDVIVWFPNDFEAPSLDVETWLTYWLAEGDPAKPPRVLIIVGRDFDAAPDYWTQVQGQAPKGLKKEYARRLAEAQSDAATNRPGKLTQDETDDWYRLDDSNTKRTVSKLRGPWADGVNAAKADIVRDTRMVPVDNNYEELLSDERGKVIVAEYEYQGYYDSETRGRLILIENGSWLLNARLVNHEHRKLAGKLVDSIGPPRRRVVFLESGQGGPPIRAEDPNNQPPSGLELFRVWPIGAVLTQLAALGILFALMKWPIFGIPRRWLQESNSNFSSHIVALGRLLAGGRNRLHAIHLIKLYRQALSRENVPPTEVSHSSASLSAPQSTSPPAE